MMRQIVLDTETTGLEWRKGNRIVEIGCVELIGRKPTGNDFHVYLNPERDFEEGAREVTGLSLEFLADKPKFAEVAQSFVDYIRGAELIIHNAKFDVGFLDYELGQLDTGFADIASYATVTDTLDMARQRWPGQRNSLDALVKRLDVAPRDRTYHGALLDAGILADVYLAMTSGQCEIGFLEPIKPVATSADRSPAPVGHLAPSGTSAMRPRVQVSTEEQAAHEARLDAIAGKAGEGVVWRRLAE